MPCGRLEQDRSRVQSAPRSQKDRVIPAFRSRYPNGFHTLRWRRQSGNHRNAFVLLVCIAAQQQQQQRTRGAGGGNKRCVLCTSTRPLRSIFGLGHSREKGSKGAGAGWAGNAAWRAFKDGERGLFIYGVYCLESSVCFRVLHTESALQASFYLRAPAPYVAACECPESPALESCSMITVHPALPPSWASGAKAEEGVRQPER